MQGMEFNVLGKKNFKQLFWESIYPLYDLLSVN
jgi:hypothetical protein